MRGATAVVDLAALRHNLARVRALAAGRRVVAVVKANGYGHGAARLLPALQAADMLAVACIEEALALRAAGAHHPVLLLEGVFEPAELAECLQHRFEIVVHEPGQLAWLEEFGGAGRLATWLKLDAGMGRLGFLAGEFGRAWQRLADCRAVGELRLMSHLGCADEPDHCHTPQQLRRVQQTFAGLPGQRSVANSAAVLAWPEAHGDWVRPGVMLYGVSPMAGESGRDRDLKPVMELASRIIAVKDMPAGSTIGYGASHRCLERTRVGIVAMGYGDGYPRHCPTGTPVLVGGVRTRTLGRVSMDMIAVDLGPVGEVGVGAPVTLWGAGLPVEEIAACAGTIAYELLCGVTNRVRFRVRDDCADAAPVPPIRSPG